jgi:hypothetical protein
MGAAKKYWGVMREQLDALYAEGLIGKEGYEAIATKHQFYSPRRFVEFIDPQTIKPNGEMRHDSGVDALDKGSESAMAADPMYLMAHVITRTQNRLFRNRANKALYIRQSHLQKTALSGSWRKGTTRIEQGIGKRVY